MLYPLIRSLLFRMDAEASHQRIMQLLSNASSSKTLTRLIDLGYGCRVPDLPVEVMGIRFPNPVGLAAGLDKQASAINALSALGFGWIETGTVTPKPQPGNPQPRLFRLTEYEAIINRMGFNSCGLDQFSQNLEHTSGRPILAINIGKNASTALDRAVDDYLLGLRQVSKYADYVCINISSPNTHDLRSLQENTHLKDLLKALDNERCALSDQYGKAIPLVVKIAPDLDNEQIHYIADTLVETRMDGVAATNTTLSRIGVESHIHSGEVGGLSGKPLCDNATLVIETLYQHLQGEIAIVGIGGIDSADTAWEKLAAGAELVQICTGFIYQGPALIRNIVRGLRSRTSGGNFHDTIKSARPQ